MTTLSSRVLGRHLRALRDQAGLTGSYVAAAMECSPAKISRQEHGTHSITVTELSHLVTQLYRREDQEEGECRKILVELEALRRRAAHGRGWWMENAGDIPWHERAYLEVEDEAESLITFSFGMPGILQTPDFVRAQAQNFGTTDPATIDRAVQMRWRRRARLHDDERPLRLDAVITEEALGRCRRSQQKNQLAALLDYVDLPNVTISVLPESAGIHGITATYIALKFPDDKLGPVMHLEYIGGSILVEDEEAVALTVQRHRSLSVLDPEDSKSMIQKYAT